MRYIIFLLAFFIFTATAGCIPQPFQALRGGEISYNNGESEPPTISPEQPIDPVIGRVEWQIPEGRQLNELKVLPLPRQKSVADQADFILKNRCYQCHDSTSSGFGNIGYMDDLQKMIANGIIVPGDPAASPLFDSVSKYRMPKGTPLPSEEIYMLGAWISLGAPKPGPAQSPPAPNLGSDFKSQLEVVEAIERDVVRLRNQGIDPTGFRYFSAEHMNNNQIPQDKVIAFRDGLAKLTNSMSWEDDLVEPTPIEGSALVFRMNIFELGWSQDQWELIEARYPYDITSSPTAGALIRADAEIQARLDRIKQEVNTQVPLMRLDWFLFETSKPPLYHDLALIPEDIRVLEQDLNLNLAAAIQAGQPTRAGFLDSGVSAQNRVMERHTIAFGAYWKSYDFITNAGDQNIFVAPLGPSNLGLNFEANKQFTHNGGEIIFNLPNGMQAYALVDANDVRIDVAPTEIVQDFLRSDRTVTNGISCMVCHNRGMNRNYDEIRAVSIAAFEAFDPDFDDFAPFQDNDYQALLNMYVNNVILDSLFDTDESTFVRSLAELGIDPNGREPIGLIAYEYEDTDMTLEDIAQEFDVVPDVLRFAIQEDAEARFKFGVLLTPNGRLPKDTYEDSFIELYDLVFVPRF